MVASCGLPLTARSVVDVLITELAVFHFRDDGMWLVELHTRAREDQVEAATEAHYKTELRA